MSLGHIIFEVVEAVFAVYGVYSLYDKVAGRLKGVKLT